MENRKTRRIQTLVPALIASCWALFLLVPYSFAGESWGAVWYALNRPLAEIVKPYLFPVNVFLYVGLVTLINVSLLYCLGWLFLRVLSRRKSVAR